MGHDENGPVAPGGLEEVGEGIDGRRVHVVRRLVQDDDLRLATEAGPDREELKLTAGKSVDARAEERPKGLGGLGVGAGELQELVRTKRHVGVADGALALVRDGDSGTPDDLAREDARSAREGSDERRLSAAVRPDEAEDVPGMEVEGDGAHDGPRVTGDDLPIGEERLGAHFPEATPSTQRSMSFRYSSAEAPIAGSRGSLTFGQPRLRARKSGPCPGW